MQSRKHNSFRGNPLETDPGALLADLTSRQFLHPRDSVRSTLGNLCDELGCCPVAVDRAVAWLAIDAGRAIGRLKRGEIVQLARAIHRFWSQSLAASKEPT